MLMPKRVKHRKVFRGRMKGAAHRGNFLAYGEFGLQATEPCWVPSQETAREALRLASHKLPLKSKIITRAAQNTEAGGDKE